MGKMALGYGSEFHLLRWMGRHRNEFDQKVKDLLNIDNITWLDFKFDNGEIPDRELIGLEFLEGEPNCKSILSDWKKEWPQTGNSMNWDLIGFTEKDGEITWILVEAKAHLAEIKQNCGAESNESIEKIDKALENTARNIGVQLSKTKPWTKKYYQMANRVYVMDLMKRNNVHSKLLNIYFLGDKIASDRKSPKNQSEWEEKIDEMKSYLDIKDKCENIYDLFLNVK